LCENKAVAILVEVQAGRPTIIHKDGGEMLITIVLDKPLAKAKELVDEPRPSTAHRDLGNGIVKTMIIFGDLICLRVL